VFDDGEWMQLALAIGGGNAHCSGILLVKYMLFFLSTSCFAPIRIGSIRQILIDLN